MVDNDNQVFSALMIPKIDIQEKKNSQAQIDLKINIAIANDSDTYLDPKALAPKASFLKNEQNA